jgi:hypothetical protein
MISESKTSEAHSIHGATNPDETEVRMEKTTPDTLESIDLTPHWPSMFRLAVQLCRAGLERGEGRDMVIEMLEFGARLEAAQEVEA